MVLGVVVANCSGDHFGRMRTWRHSSEALIALSLQLRLGTGPAVATQTARLLGTNRGFDTRLPGGSYEGQCRCAFFVVDKKIFQNVLPVCWGERFFADSAMNQAAWKFGVRTHTNKLVA